jgi:hypothetical protein
VTRRFDVTGRRLDLVTRLFDVTGRRFDLVTRRFDVTGRRVDLATPRFDLTRRRLDLATHSFAPLTPERPPLDPRVLTRGPWRLDLSTLSLRPPILRR